MGVLYAIGQLVALMKTLGDGHRLDDAAFQLLCRVTRFVILASYPVVKAYFLCRQ